jgi:hypothetical protein
MLVGTMLMALMMDAQSYAVAIKGGGTMGIQQWSGVERSPLFAYHGMVAIESADDDEKYSLYSELGYHERGSALRNAQFTDFSSGNIFDLPAQRFQFNNVALTLGAKSKTRISPYVLATYGFAVRGEYTVSTNLGDYEDINNQFGGIPVFPLEEFVRNWNYGINVMGGFEYEMSEYVNAIIELRVCPDFSAQYLQPEVPNVRNPTTGQNTTLREERIVNVSVELSVGLRFLRKIIYID